MHLSFSYASLVSPHNRNERSFTGRKERQEACVALKFQGSKNKMGAWIPMAADGERWWRAQQHAPTGQNYSWAADWSLGCRRLTPASDNQHKWLQNRPPQNLPSSGDLKLVLELHKPPPERPFCLNFVSKAAFQSLLGFGLLSRNFETMKGKR